MRVAALLACALAAAASLEVAAKRLYEFRDAKGVRHFTDRAPSGDTVGAIKEMLVEVDRAPIVDLNLHDGNRERHVSFVNRLAGPVEIEVKLDNALNIASDPPAPLTVVLAPREQRTVMTIRSADPAQKATYTVNYRALPGDPTALPDLDYRYAVPVPADSGYALHQGFGGNFSHKDLQSYYAVDLAVDEGTPVLAARDAYVMQVEQDFDGAGTDAKHAARANYVRLLHDDGTMSVYAHLMLEGVAVRVGERVKRGQVIAKSGNTGYSTGPHLHFAVQMNLSMSLESIPFKFDGLVIPERDSPNRYPALGQ